MFIFHYTNTHICLNLLIRTQFFTHFYANIHSLRAMHSCTSVVNTERLYWVLHFSLMKALLTDKMCLAHVLTVSEAGTVECEHVHSVVWMMEWTRLMTNWKGENTVVSDDSGVMQPVESVEIDENTYTERWKLRVLVYNRLLSVSTSRKYNVIPLHVILSSSSHDIITIKVHNVLW